ncbi:MAG: hypothetical protein H6907_09265 [Hyphomicrobiales bacterium]|nr:hypothetical protein [Hyphomicrobiales bacterium]MCP5371907.1 hypothetical protein [Hyphomicrobiales bacterium]
MSDDKNQTLGKMDPTVQQRLFREQTAEVYAAIGRFVVEFENACSALRFGMMQVLWADGLQSQPLGQILLDNKFMTAAPLIEMHDAIMQEIGARSDPIQAEVLNQVSLEFRSLMEERNRLVHGHWFIGYAGIDDADYSKIGGLKGKPSKKRGMTFESLPESKEEIEELADRAKELSLFLTEISSALHLQWTTEGSKGKFENNFTKVGANWNRERPAKNR